jgi:tetratricopeptide (TPR) repeat protein
VLAVIAVVYDPRSDRAYWEVVADHTIRRTPEGFVLPIPQDQPFTIEAREKLIAVSHRRDETALANFEVNLQRLPASAVVALRDASASDNVGAALLADMLALGRFEPALTATAVTNGQPSWLTNSTAVGELWEAVGGYLDEHELQQEAGNAFLRSAELGGSKSARRRAFAGLSFKAAGDRSAAKAALERALADGLGMLADVGLAGWDNEVDDAHPVEIPASAAAATDVQLDAEPTVALFLAEQCAREGRLGEAVRLASRVASRNLRAPRAQIALTEHLGRRLALEGYIPGSADFSTAETAAKSALGLMRAWDGPSQRALLALTKLYLTNGHATEATMATSPAPGGTATEREAKDLEVAAQGATAALISQNDEALAYFEEVLGDDPQRLIVEVQRSELTGDEEQVRTKIAAAFEALQTDADKTRLMGRMASLGIWPIAEVEDMHQRGMFPDVLYQIMAAMAEASTSAGTAIPKLRNLASQNPFAATQLPVLVEKHSGLDEAIKEAERQSQRWQADDMIAVLRIDLLRRANNRDPEAAQLTRELVQHPTLSPDIRLRLRRWLFAHEFNHQRWKEAIAVAQAALPDAGTDRSTHWELVGALWNAGRFGAAREVIRQYDLRPTTNQDVRLWGQLHLGVDWTGDEIRMAMALADSDPGAAVNVPLLRGAAREVMFDTNQREGLAPSIPGHRPLDSAIGEEVRAALDRHGLAGQVLDGGSEGTGKPLQVAIPEPVKLFETDFSRILLCTLGWLWFVDPRRARDRRRGWGLVHEALGMSGVGGVQHGATSLLDGLG